MSHEFRTPLTLLLGPLQEELRKTGPNAQFAIDLRHDEESFVRRMLRAGAAGYVLKQSPSAAMTTAIRAVARGE